MRYTAEVAHALANFHVQQQRIAALEAERDQLAAALAEARSALLVAADYAARADALEDDLEDALASARAALEEIGRDGSGPSARLVGGELTKTVAARTTLRRLDALTDGKVEEVRMA